MIFGGCQGKLLSLHFVELVQKSIYKEICLELFFFLFFFGCVCFKEGAETKVLEVLRFL